ncbi:MAG TPA: pseudouridine-5'-phosphate glycosidase [Acidimicrobiales bacterium]|nr:pseudouridine-5'-phosphate glycosidase [Acidimicrobiales bacterium]
MPAPVRVAAEVADAVAAGRAVVALESTIIAHGLPRPDNLRVAGELEAIVRAGGAVPATIAVLDGMPCVGLDDGQLRRVADEGLRKLAARDLAPAMATGASGATTVSATAVIAARAGLRVFATGGLGGVHRDWVRSQDESADLDALRATRLIVVCSGVKSILDVPATLQRLETLNVTVVGYRTREFPGFYVRRSGHQVGWRVDEPAEAAAVLDRQEGLGLPGAVVVANPVPESEELDPDLHDRALAEALGAARDAGVTGPAITPWLLERLVRATGGASLAANVAAVRGNAALAAAVAVALAGG